MHKRGMPARILDILEMDGGWMNAHQIHAELEVRFGDTKLASVRRAMQRLAVDGDVETQLVEAGWDKHQRQELEIAA